MDYDITLIFPNSPFLINEQVFPPLGVLYLASFLRKWGHSPQVLDFSSGRVESEVKSDIVGISLTTPQRDHAYELAKTFKRQGKITIAGGAHATHMSKECLENGFDYVIRGEGEVALESLLLRIKTDMMPSDRILGNASNLIPLDRLPMPARDLIDLHDYRYTIEGRYATTIMTTRGCPFHCTFCARVTRSYRQASAKTVVNEIDHLNKTHGFSAFMIFDDVFIASKKRIESIVGHLEMKDYKFRCFARSNLIDEDIVSLLKRMGVVEVGIGVESGSDRILRKSLKGTSSAGNLEAFRLLKKEGIRAKAFIIVGLPGESEESVRETEVWIKQARPDDIDFTIFQPLPGSPIFERPELWDIKFEYNSNPMWYKGTPGEYESNVSTEALSAERIVELRDELEEKYKDKELLR